MDDGLRIQVAFGLTLLLVMLRLEAERFGAAEYDEPRGGRTVSYTHLTLPTIYSV